MSRVWPKLLLVLNFLFQLPSNLQGWGQLSISVVLGLFTGVWTWLQVHPVLAIPLALLVYAVALLLARTVWPTERRPEASASSSPSVQIGSIEHFEGNLTVQEPGHPQTPATDSQPKSSSPTYRENERINIAELACEVAEIRMGNEVIADRTFKNCRIFGPAALWVQEPERPMTFIACEWSKREQSFSIMRSEEYAGDAKLVGLHHCMFLGCHFEHVEMLVSQETYDRYENGEISL